MLKVLLLDIDKIEWMELQRLEQQGAIFCCPYCPPLHWRDVVNFVVIYFTLIVVALLLIVSLIIFHFKLADHQNKNFYPLF